MTPRARPFGSSADRSARRSDAVADRRQSAEGCPHGIRRDAVAARAIILVKAGRAVRQWLFAHPRGGGFIGPARETRYALRKGARLPELGRRRADERPGARPAEAAAAFAGGGAGAAGGQRSFGERLACREPDQFLVERPLCAGERRHRIETAARA